VLFHKQIGDKISPARKKLTEAKSPRLSGHLKCEGRKGSEGNCTGGETQGTVENNTGRYLSLSDGLSLAMGAVESSDETEEVQGVNEGLGSRHGQEVTNQSGIRDCPGVWERSTTNGGPRLKEGHQTQWGDF